MYILYTISDRSHTSQLNQSMKIKLEISRATYNDNEYCSWQSLILAFLVSLILSAWQWKMAKNVKVMANTGKNLAIVMFLPALWIFSLCFFFSPFFKGKVVINNMRQGGRGKEVFNIKKKNLSYFAAFILKFICSINK